MANQIKLIVGTEYTLEANGGSTSNGTYTQADDANLTIANVAGYPALVIEFSGALGVTGTTGSVIDIYMRPLNFEGTNDAQAPSATHQHTWVASIPYDSAVTTSTFYHRTPVVANPHPLTECAFYIANRTGQTLSAGWTLKVTPISYQPV